MTETINLMTLRVMFPFSIIYWIHHKTSQLVHEDEEVYLLISIFGSQHLTLQLKLCIRKQIFQNNQNTTW